IAVGPHSVGEVEDRIAPARRRCAAPNDPTAIGRQETGDQLKQGRLARAVGPDDSEHFPCRNRKAHVIDRKLPAAVALCEPGNVQRRTVRVLLGLAHFTITHSGASNGYAIKPITAVAAMSRGLLTFQRNRTASEPAAISTVSQSPMAMRPSR